MLEAKIRDAKAAAVAPAASPALTDMQRRFFASPDLVQGPGLERVVRALATPAASDPLFDSTSNGELPMHALRSQVAAYRELGLDELSIAQALHGARCPRNIIAQAKTLYDGLMSEPSWVAKLAAGDRAANKENVLMSIVMNAMPTD
jgi:hypothetical protein